MNVWYHWTNYYDSDEDFHNQKNFEKNMDTFDEHVNEFIKEGWRPHGPSQFSAGWFTGCRSTGSAIQTMVKSNLS